MTVADKIKYDYEAMVKNYATANSGQYPHTKLNFNSINVNQRVGDGRLLRAGGINDS